MREVVIAGAVRTAIGKLGGALAGVDAVDLGAAVLKEAVRRSGLEAGEVEEVIFGQVIQAGCGPNPARQALLKAGLPISVPGFTVNKVCASGMKAVALGALAVASGEREVVAVGGMESMSRAPYLLAKAREGYRFGDGTLSDAVLSDALRDPAISCLMGDTAENVAREFGIGRGEQDAFAAGSQQKAKAAMEAKRFEAEVHPVPVPQRRGGPVLFGKDEFPRPDTTVEKLAALKPAFAADGTVTAGNASGINDGAAAMVLLPAAEAARRGIRPMGTIRAWASAGVEPERMGMGPVPAAQRALEKVGLKVADVEAVELNEAFAAQSLAVIRQLGLDPGRVNLNGGAIALGHPVGASGARILVTLLHILADRGLRRGLATLCVGGGQGMAMVVEGG